MQRTVVIHSADVIPSDAWDDAEPSIQIRSVAEGPMCIIDNIALSVDSIFLGTGSQTATLTATTGILNPHFVWSGSGAAFLSSTSSSTTVFTPTAAGVFQFILTVTNTLTGCSASLSKTIVVSDRASICGWIMVAKKEIHLHENSDVLYGGVGVTNSNGKVHVHKHSSVPLPGFVMAANIDIHNEAIVDSAIYSPANPTLPAMFLPSNASTSSLSNLVITANGTYNSNYKDLTVNDGLTVTLGGNLYRKIKIKKNSIVTFSQPDITLESIDVDENVTLLFSGSTKMRVKDKVKLHKAAMVNPAPSVKLVFYIDDPLESDDNNDKFDVDGEGTLFVGSVMMPTGKIHVHGGGSNPNTTMKGFYYAEKIESDGKNVTWLSDCAHAPLRMISGNVTSQSASGPAYGIMIYPNPSRGEFSLQFEKVLENADVRITDMQGRLVESRTIFVNQMPSVNFNLSGWSTGLYLIEVRQGGLHRWTKLMVQ